MQAYCVKCRKKVEMKNAQSVVTRGVYGKQKSTEALVGYRRKIGG